MDTLQITWITPHDLNWVTGWFTRYVYDMNADKAYTHFADHGDGRGATCLAHMHGELAGFVTIRWQSHHASFRRENIPLIHHLEVFPAFRRQGLASCLMDEAEKLIATRASKAGITVGLFDAYGPAQRLYAKRGYIPDGRGACKRHEPLRQGEVITIDHDILIWMTKDL
jgi:GNAT superfamily N-acetyltransferase